MSAKGNFYKFIESLQEDENAKSFEMRQVLDGATQVYPNQKNTMKTPNIKVRKLQNELNSGELGFEAFLNKVTFLGNKLMDDLATDLPADVQVSDESDEDVGALESDPELEPAVNLTDQLDDAKKELNCIICVDRRKTQVLQPCGHMVMFDECVAKLVNTGPLICPICRADVTYVITAICC